MSRKLSEFAKLCRQRRISIQEAAELFQVTPRTVRNWLERGAPPLVMRRLWEEDGRLDALHPSWVGFKIGANGKLYGPNRLQFSPEYLRRWDQVLRCPCCQVLPADPSS